MGRASVTGHGLRMTLKSPKMMHSIMVLALIGTTVSASSTEERLRRVFGKLADRPAPSGEVSEITNVSGSQRRLVSHGRRLGRRWIEDVGWQYYDSSEGYYGGRRSQRRQGGQGGRLPQAPQWFYTFAGILCTGILWYTPRHLGFNPLSVINVGWGEPVDCLLRFIAALIWFLGMVNVLFYC